ncbi:ATP-dependent RNA helicase [Candidatus Poribacteria bacterium]|nr:ATP-dependent RNA helicase [Candidatus Poribacteria bacterium]
MIPKSVSAIIPIMNDPTLPITELKETFQDAIAKSPVVIVAPTGSGKSTQIPPWCAALSDEPVLVVEPRRVACRSLARWVAHQLGEPLGHSVGYTVRFEDVSSDTLTRIRFVTPGIALRYAAGQELDLYGTIILDEFHERGVETDLFLAICQKKRPDARLIIMSATIAAQQLARFIGGQVLRAEGRVYPVEVRYLGGAVVPTSHNLVERVEKGIHHALNETVGNILVFLPGKGEINASHDALRKRRHLEIIPLHGDLPPDAQDKAFDPQSQRRRVILATNVAETSITLPGITAVVDTGLVRQRVHQSRRIVLALCPISQASAEQRRGRAGRLGPGICYRLWEEHGQLEQETLPEIRREDLTQFVLTVASTGYRPQDLTFLDAPPDFAVERAQTALKSWGVLSDDGTLTTEGAKICALPINPLHARLLVKAPSFLRRDLIDLIATLERPAPLWQRIDRLPTERQDTVREIRQKELFRDACDATTAIRTLRHGNEKRHHLHNTALTECRRIATQLRDFFELPPVMKDKAPVQPDRNALIAYLLREWDTCAYVRRRKGKGWGNGHEEVLLDSDSLLPEERNAALILETVGIAKGTRVQLMGRTAMPCSFDDLVNAGIGTSQLTAPRLEGEDIVAEVVTKYAGREIGRSRQPLSGTLLREALASLILSGSALPGVGELLTRAIDAWILHCALNPDMKTSETTDLTPHTWLVSQLDILGVEVAADWQLLSPEDLVFTKIDADTIAEIETQYPKEFSVNGAKFDVEYDPIHKLVTLHWKQGVRQPTLSTVLLPHWNNWKVQLDVRGQRRTVRP